jgi:hypothetical protein
MEKCIYCYGTGLDPETYDEHIQSNGFWFARACKFCEGRGFDLQLFKEFAQWLYHVMRIYHLSINDESNVNPLDYGLKEEVLK